jgi:branched-subunit amino acid permease
MKVWATVLRSICVVAIPLDTHYIVLVQIYGGKNISNHAEHDTIDIYEIVRAHKISVMGLFCRELLASTITLCCLHTAPPRILSDLNCSNAGLVQDANSSDS